MKINTFKLAALYRCRMCGTTFRKGEPVSPSRAVSNTCALAMNDKTDRWDLMYIRSAHFCDEDRIGIGDFIGYTSEYSDIPKDE